MTLNAKRKMREYPVIKNIFSPFRSFCRLLIPTVFLISTVTVISCSPIQATRGNLIDKNRIETVQVGIDTKSRVISQFGTPTVKSSFNEDIWLYIGEINERIAFLDPKVKERRIVKVTFDKNDTVEDISVISEAQAQKIKPVNKTTPTSGLKMNAFQQFLSNLGRFNREARPDSQAENSR